MTMTEMVLQVLESNPNAKSFRFKTRTCPKLTKKNRTTKEPTDFTVEIMSDFTASLGVNYQDETNRILAENHMPADFEAQKPVGKHYVRGTNWLLESDTAPGKYYVAMCRFSNRHTTYLKNGIPVKQEELEDLKLNYLPKPSANAPVVEWKTYSVESIVSAEPVEA